MKRLAVCIFALLTLLSWRTWAAEPFYVIAVGYNGLPPQLLPDQEQLRPLRFADDDAAEMFSLLREASDDGMLLTELDADTSRRHPEMRASTRAPTLIELRNAVRQIADRVAADRRAGAVPTVIFFYSGHGFALDEGPGLSLEDGSITPQVLYDQVIEPLSASQLHLLVDACHAEAVVRPRDATAEVVDITPADAEAYLQRTTLERYRSVGAIVATTRGARAHEWEMYRAGIFTHELLSGLRGGADVNGDGRIEYSELEAFLSAANQNVVDPRARVDTVVHVPRSNERAPLIDLARLSASGRLRGHLARLGPFHVEDERGTRILDVHAEAGSVLTLVLPSDRILYLRTRDAEAEITLQPGEVRTLDGTALHSPTVAERGAIESALRRGLFGVGYGPGYYSGYMAHAGAAVALSVEDDRANPEPVRPAWQESAGWLCFGASTVLGVATVGMTLAAYSSYRDSQGTSWEREARSARDTFVQRRDLAISLAMGTAATSLAGIILWRTPRKDGLKLTASVAAPGITLSGMFR